MNIIFEKWFCKGNKYFSIISYKEIWKKKKNKRKFYIKNNNAIKGKDKRYDLTIYLGYIVISYTNYNY